MRQGSEMWKVGEGQNKDCNSVEILEIKFWKAIMLWAPTSYWHPNTFLYEATIFPCEKFAPLWCFPIRSAATHPGRVGVCPKCVAAMIENAYESAGKITVFSTSKSPIVIQLIIHMYLELLTHVKLMEFHRNRNYVFRNLFIQFLQIMSL